MNGLNETWIPVKDWEDRYEVSNLGRVRSLLDYHLRPKTPVLKKTYVGKRGYEVVSFYRHKKMFLLKIHRLLAVAFTPNPHNKPVVNHINGIRNDNRLENLEWSTYKENTNHAFKIGNMKGTPGINAKLTKEDVIGIKTDIKQGVLNKDLYLKYPILTSKNLWNIKNQTWKHITV